MRALVVPDSFKGSLSAARAAATIAAAFRRAGWQAEEIPVADGGEGTVEAFRLGAGAHLVNERVTGPLGSPVLAQRALLAGGVAIVELAQSAGLHLGAGRVGEASTFGVGEQLVRAAREGAGRIVVGIGGSATNDGGCGAAAAAGVRFFDSDGAAFLPTGATLGRIASLDASGLDPALRAAEIVAMCDVTNPLTGPAGAAAVFGPQKGADARQVAELDAGLAHLATLVARDLGVDVRELPGGGAAGGMGAGLVAFFGARLERGIDIVLDQVGLAPRLVGADAVISGEGSFDAQSLAGKVVLGVAARCQEAGVPLHVLAGRVEAEAARAARRRGVTSVTAINPPGEPFEVSRARADEHLAVAAAELARRLTV